MMENLRIILSISQKKTLEECFSLLIEHFIKTKFMTLLF